MSTASGSEYMVRCRMYLESVPEDQRESARASLVGAAEFLANELRDWRRTQKSTGEPDVPTLDVRHGLALNTLLAAFGAPIIQLPRPRQVT